MTETQNNEATLATDDGATVVITHRIRAEQNAAYEAWLDEIGRVCRSFPGHLNCRASGQLQV